MAKLQDKGINPLQGLLAGFTAMITPVADPENAQKKEGLGRVLMRFNDGRPMLLARNVGAVK